MERVNIFIMDNEKQYEEELSECIEKVSKHYPLSIFKRFVGQFLLTENDEDQWTFDYESYALVMGRSTYEGGQMHPINWAPEYYQDRWDKKSFELFESQISDGKVKGR